MSEGRVLVTGAAGLIGNAVCALLAARGRRVVAVDRAPAPGCPEGLAAVDVTDVHGLYAAVGDLPLDGVVHCGAYSGPMVARDTPHDMFRVNVAGTANVLELARVRGARRFVFCSSTSAYGPTGPGPVTEDRPLVSGTLYGASKAAGEALVRGYARQFAPDGASLRLCWVYGPRRTTDCIIRTMITDAQAGRPTRVPFGRGFPRQFIHVEDAARALVTALDAPGPLGGQAFNVTGGAFLTLDQVAAAAREVLPEADIELAEGPDPVDDLQQRFDTSAVERVLGFRPGIPLDQGIRSYAAWLASGAQAAIQGRQP
ncbi:NAD-dependent epimerase/dehydratase family protein [Paracraurococcus lichenis]|uniref:NAD(P)-dependent oxidoreductase n=1 Tax=Paracraurococcus lichenis TaxID=3064888 RepID=A0ABT9EDW6_9PROT|nr:NAD(P)-dependent oxidoreductase [Paracraurococcus sp. LOR1-02]MDO9714075.1 NAD(P)-dependent oxidoreductase [Paracraurococcus sp. LOR1-02]